MLTAAAFIIALLPVYLWLRSPYARLPLHVDTGFYVSNHTVATRRFCFSKGWNARFAACSKVFPELFYSCIYILTSRQRNSHLLMRTSYAGGSRIAASLFNYLTAVAVGLLCYQMGGSAPHFYAGLITFATLSSEPQYGVYYECGELFSLPLNVVSLALLIFGVDQQVAWPFAAAAFVWACDAFFVKLTSAVPFAVVFTAAVILFPPTVLPALLGGSAAAAIYIAWLVHNGQHPGRMLAALFRHETSLGQRADWRTLSMRLNEKARCLARSFARQPLIPALAIVGVLFASPNEPLVWWYFAGVLAAYVIQAADCWYYQIPLLPPMAVLAAFGVAYLLTTGGIGPALVVVALVAWLAMNLLRARSLDRDELARRVWFGYRPAEEIERDLAAEALAQRIGETIRGNSLIVYGPCTQAYVLLNAAYDTTIISPDVHLDEMSPSWQQQLNESLVDSPPRFILDTANVFAAGAARRRLGLDYRIIDAEGPQLRLFRLNAQSSPAPDYQEAKTFAPQSYRTLVGETALAGGVASTQAAESPPPPEWSAEARALADVLQRAHVEGLCRVAIYGAGRFTLRNCRVYEDSPVPIVAVLDDRPDRHGPTFLGRQICRPEDAHQFDVDAVIISTDRFTSPMVARAREALDPGVRVLTIRSANRRADVRKSEGARG